MKVRYGKALDAGAIVGIEFVLGPQNLSDGSRKAMHPGMIDRDIAVYIKFITDK
jgi:hypothetical protein